MRKTVGGRSWRLSSATDGVQCVGVDASPTVRGVDVINTNRAGDGILTVRRGVFVQMVEAIQAGQLDHLVTP